MYSLIQFFIFILVQNNEMSVPQSLSDNAIRLVLRQVNPVYNLFKKNSISA